MALFCSMSTATDTLTMLTWEDYIDPGIVADFEKQHDVDIQFVYFEHDEERNNLIASTNASNYDIFMVDGQSVSTYIRLGWLSPLNLNEIPNIQNHNDHWKTIRPEANGFALPYGWGTIGIAYRSDLVTSPIDNLMQLFRPEKSLQGKIIMSPQGLELIPTALLALGYDMNSAIPYQLKQAGELLETQRPFVHSYQALELNERSPLVHGEAIAAQAYSGDALVLADLNKHIEYKVPKEGSPIWIDFLGVSTRSMNKSLAHRFINYLSETDVARRNIEHTYTASFIDKAVAQLPADIRNNPIIFPPNIDHLIVYKEPAPRTMRRITNIMQNLNFYKHKH